MATDPHQPAAVSQAPPLAPLVTPPPPKPAVTESAGQPIPVLSASQRLWNAAYDSLETDDADLARSYLRTLEKVLGDETCEPTDDFSAKLKDPTNRQKHMRELVHKGQEKISKASRITTGVGEVADFILSAKEMVDLVLRGVPQAAIAALPWAGVCLGLQVSNRPFKFFSLSSSNNRPDSPESCPSNKIKSCRYRPRHLQNGLVLCLERTSLEQKQHFRRQRLPSGLTPARGKDRRALQSSSPLPGEKRLFLLSQPRSCLLSRHVEVG